MKSGEPEEKSTTEKDGEKTIQPTIAEWKAAILEFQKPNAWRASWQILNTIGGYAGLWVIMYFSISFSWWLTIPLAIVAGGFLIRIFIIFHDCGHGSFFKSRTANDIWGFITGVITSTPYYQWRFDHAVHHATTGHLDRRGVGDIWTLTVEEYLKSSRWKKFSYRLARNPIVLFVIAPLVIFVILQRIPSPGAKPREKTSVWIMNAAVVALAVGLISIFGFLPWLFIQLTIMSVGGAAGVWLFYVQHQFEDTYWESSGDWDYTAAALQGSSFYRLPRILQWFSGNIGFHHIHHLSPRIPNYNLERCHHSHPMFSSVQPTTLFGSLKSLTFRLWDEKTRKLISFRELKRQRMKEKSKINHDDQANP
ncbi:MAG: fatty acid desaturase [Verrucomicrobiales bacterium]|nr:fatty acid desaturase [Verrucomicrobiales bacterium]